MELITDSESASDSTLAKYFKEFFAFDPFFEKPAWCQTGTSYQKNDSFTDRSDPQ